MRWDFWKRETRDTPELEQRQGPFTDAIIAQLLQGADGENESTNLTAAVETAVGLWGRAFMSAQITPSDARTASLTPFILEWIGRGLCADGEAILSLSVDNDGLILRPAVAWEVFGGRELTYKLDFGAPDGTVTETLPGDSVVHVRYGVDRKQPWRGIGPLSSASETLRAASRLERRISEEANTPVGSVVGVPDFNAPGLQAILDTIKTFKGRVGFAPSIDTSYTGEGQRPIDWSPKRIGAAFPASHEPMRDALSKAILNACGIPIGLTGETDGTGARESYRQFLHATIQPVSKLVEAELAVKLDIPDLSLTFDELGAADISGRARAFQSMVGAGMTVEDAARLSNLMVSE